MTESQLIRTLSRPEYSTPDKAMILLWWAQQNGQTDGLTTYQISRKMIGYRLGNPNRKHLEDRLRTTVGLMRANRKWVLRSGQANEIRKMIGVHTEDPEEPDDTFLPKSIWSDTRGYIERVATQLCGCYEHKYFDAAAVMLRRLAETLLIEVYIQENRASEIQNSDGDFLQFGEVVNAACSTSGLSLGREAKKGLKAIKEIGDRFAHNRQIYARQPDLDNVQGVARVAIEELTAKSHLKRK